MSFTYSQKKVLSIIPHVTGSFSVAGSSCIIYEIVKHERSSLQPWRSPYHRLLLGMSCFDVISSIAFGLSTWPIPKGSPGVYAALGTRQTCSAQGFWVQASIAVPLYNVCLSLYYVLLVRYVIPKDVIRQKYEPWMHGFIIFFSLGTAFVGLGMGWYNDSSLWCWFNGLPKGCKQSYKNDGTTDCERGDNTQIFRWAFYYAWLWASIVGTMIFMFLIWKTVRKQEDKTFSWSQKWHETKARIRSSLSKGSASGDRSSQISGAEPDGVSQDGKSSHHKSLSRRSLGWMSSLLSSFRESDDEERADRRKSNAVMWQALRYVSAFWLTWLFGSLNRLLQLAGHNIFWVMVLHSFFVPLQGFLNFLVYRYPEFKKRRAAKKKKPKPREKNGRGDANGNGNGDGENDVASNIDNAVASSVALRQFDNSSIARTACNDRKGVTFSDDDHLETFFENEEK